MKNYSPINISFYPRKNRNLKRDYNIYCCIKLKGQNSKEICIEKGINKKDWNTRKGRPKPTSEYLIKLGVHLDAVKAKLLNIYLNLKLEETATTAGKIRDIYLGKEDENHTLLQLVDKAILKYENELSPGSLKNYKTTRVYLEAFCNRKFKKGDISLKLLNYSFIDNLKTYILAHPIKPNEPCTNNGCMKHMERVKKIIKWAYEMEYIERNVFAPFRIRRKRYESKVLTWAQISALKRKVFADKMLGLVRDLFLFSCYTGMAPYDLQNLKPHQIYPDAGGTIWLTYTRGKSIIAANIPLLNPAIELLKKYNPEKSEIIRHTSFPKVSNKDLNKNLKMIGEICEIGIPLNFYMARHTFATTVTLGQGVSITSIKEMMGHEKIETTMNYAKINKPRIATEMAALNERLQQP